MDESNSSTISFSRASSISESQIRSTMAEKRMGRLFKQPQSLQDQKANGESRDVKDARETGEDARDARDARDTRDIRDIRDTRYRSRTISTSQTPHAATHSSNNATTAAVSSHSTSSSASSTASTASAMTSPASQPSLPSMQTPQRPALPRKLSMGSRSVTMKFTTVKQTPPQILPQIQTSPLMQPGSLSSSSAPSQSLVHGLVPLSRKFRFIYRETIMLIRHLDLDKTVTLEVGAYPSFSALLDTVEKKQSAKESFEKLLSPLANSLTRSMKDLCTLIDGLGLCAASLASCESESLRMAYFTLLSLLIEAINMCRILSPLQIRLRKQASASSSMPLSMPSSSSSTSVSSPFSTSTRSKSQRIRKTPVNSPAALGRAPPPNPQHTGQSIPVVSKQLPFSVATSSSSATLSSIQRPPLKIDTSINSVRRQDSELSIGSAFSDMLATSSAIAKSSFTEDDKLFDLIAYTIQASQVVFSQMNTAISKSAMTTAQTTEDHYNPTIGESNELDHVGQKIKEMTMLCIASMEQTKRINTTLLSAKKSNKLDEEAQKRLYEETNLFLKSIINVLAATKGAIQDIPALNEVRGALSNLTRATKELTIRLETSALKQAVMSNTSSSTTLVEQPPLSAIPSVANFQPFSAHMNSVSPTRYSPPPSVSASQAANTITSGSTLSPSFLPKTEIDLKEGVSMQQHIMGLKTTKNEIISPMQTPLTTPLVASIGPTAASAVLPTTTTTTTTPSPQANNSHDMELNPFDKLLGKR
ncbi:hypothetical protein FOA43_004440 [Brettanomyces nanus]|uniref:Uncharacterized protein n=1 Tax=Eeniella nana TaxID=13502 RepID=A0A875S814_EENNA|nr:uncharacterized protein FOA43_004440 [Brettanomyces nanus]QPG77043.1 hypothetical protein FOA43_004440 [Brettanomyces nanus]